MRDGLQRVNGLHHITAIAGPAQQNLDFYVGVMGMRLVKKSVNQDDTGTYHLFYADAEGHPGTDLTFFPWARLAPPRVGHGMALEVSLEVPPGSLTYWAERLERYGTRQERIEERFGERSLPLADPHGLRLALVESRASARRFAPWLESDVPPERQVRGLHGARVWEREAATSAAFLTGVLGFEAQAAERGWTRYGVAGGAGVLDVREMPGERRGAWGVGSVHHLAWRVEDEEHQRAVRQQVEAAGAEATPVIDRFWFKSVYFREPGGVLFELATEGPGFTVDEDPAHLGETLVLPPWLEADRAAIERSLPALTLGAPAGRGRSA
ncbi:MAG: ring-cleaving dioxygenase [Candidatus Methylomirabilales bacterium]